MSLIKQLFPAERKFTPASAEVNWQRVETLVHGPGAGETNRNDANSAVFACLMAIANAYPEPPLTVYQTNKKGKAKKLADSPLQSLLDSPTPDGALTVDEILFWTAWAKHADGNAYWLKVRSGDAETGNVIQLWPISPALIKPVTIKNSGDWISYYEYQVQPGVIERVSPSNIVHFRLGLDDRDMRKGLSPLKSLLRQVSTDEEADRFVDALLKNYAVPGLVVIPTNGGSMTEDDADRITDKLGRKFGSDNRGNVAVMSRESKIEQFGFSPAELDMTTLHRIPEERISAVMGVPAVIAGLGAGLDRATYSNSDSMAEWFTERKLIPQWRADARKLNVALKPDFTSDKSTEIRFDLTDVRSLQEDEDKRYTRLKAATGKPWLTRNEARADTGYDPVDGWDEEDITPPPPPAPPQTNQDGQGKPQDGQGNQQDGAKADLERWRAKAIKALAKGESASVPFTSDTIPADTRQAVASGLLHAQTADEVNAVFDAPHHAPDLAAELKRACDLLEMANYA